MWRPKFLFPELEIPAEPSTILEDSRPVGDFHQRNLSSDDEEWDDEESQEEQCIKLDNQDDTKEKAKNDENEGKEDPIQQKGSRSREISDNNLNQSTRSFVSAYTISLEDSCRGQISDSPKESAMGTTKAPNTKHRNIDNMMDRPKSLISHHKNSDPPRVIEDVSPVGDNHQLELESDDEWDDESEEDIKFNDNDKDDERDTTRRSLSQFWADSALNQSSSSVSSGFTINMDDALDDLRELHEDDKEDIKDLKAELKQSLAKTLPLKSSSHSSTTLSSGCTMISEDSMNDLRGSSHSRNSLRGSSHHKRNVRRGSRRSAPTESSGNEKRNSIPMWRPKFLFPELDVPEPPPVSSDHNDQEVAEFHLEFEESDGE